MSTTLIVRPEAEQDIDSACRFPYVVIYHYDEPNDTVIVHGVFHTSQDPAIWQQRLP